MSSSFLLQNNLTFFCLILLVAEIIFMLVTWLFEVGWRSILTRFNSSGIHWVPTACPVVDLRKGRR